MITEELEAISEHVLEDPGVVFLLGGIDVGKTSFGVELVRRATQAGISSAFVDADIGQSTVGPPTTVGLRLCEGMDDFGRTSLSHGDALAFVGSITPRGHLLPLVVGTAKLVARARAQGCRLIVVDSTGYVSGVYGQLLKFHKMTIVAPDLVIAMERGGELEPVVGIARRFTEAEVVETSVDPDAGNRSVEERVSYREQQFAGYFAAGVHRWRVKPTVFMPALPAEFDLALLDELVVGMEDGKGSCVGIGVLEYDSGEDLLRMVSPVTEGVRGLRLGSLRIETTGRAKGPVEFRNLFMTE